MEVRTLYAICMFMAKQVPCDDKNGSENGTHKSRNTMTPKHKDVDTIQKVGVFDIQGHVFCSEVNLPELQVG
jgi:hypothetical protein